MSTDVEKRLKEHNNGQVFSTKSYKPWKLFYKELVGDRVKARKREKYLKSGCGKEFLKSIKPL
jgi:putative endonuclease